MSNSQLAPELPVSPSVRGPRFIRTDRSIIFSDVDGTLIDLDGRPVTGWQDIRASLADRRIVLTSSRTIEELIAVQNQLGLTGSMIAENGALMALSEDLADVAAGTVVRIGHREIRIVPMGTPANHLRAIIKGAAAASGVKIEAERGLVASPQSTAGSGFLSRTHSVLVKVAGVVQDRLRFFGTLTSAGLTVSHGGRWHVVQGGSSKGVAARAFTHLLRQKTRETIRTIGVGDGDNDASLMAAVDERVIVRLSDGSVHPALREFQDHAFVPAVAGIEGWHEIAAWLQSMDGRSDL